MFFLRILWSKKYRNYFLMLTCLHCGNITAFHLKTLAGKYDIRSNRPEVFCRKGVFEIWQNLQENTCARVSFLIKLQAFYRIPPVAASGFCYVYTKKNQHFQKWRNFQSGQFLRLILPLHNYVVVNTLSLPNDYDHAFWLLSVFLMSRCTHVEMLCRVFWK